MEWGEYARAAAAQSVYPHASTRDIIELTYLGLGLAGEAGETVDVIKKIQRAGYQDFDEIPPEAIKKLLEEMGDLMWYVTRLLQFCHCPLYALLQENHNKLQKRHSEGTIKDMSHDDKNEADPS